MDRETLVAELRGALGAAADRFEPEDSRRHLDQAANALSAARPHRAIGTLYVIAGEAVYPAPADLSLVLYTDWGAPERHRVKPWDPRHPGPAPRLKNGMQDGARVIVFEPPPSALDIERMGASVRYWYQVRQRVAEDAADTTVPESALGLLILRAMVSAMHELAAAGVTAPVQLRRQIQSVPSNSTPSAVAEALLRVYEREAAR